MSRRAGLRRVAAALAAAALLGLVALGLGQVRLETSLTSFLPPDDAGLAAYERLGAEFGGEPVVVMVETDDPKVLTTERLPELVGLEGALSRLPRAAAAYGPGTLLNQVAGQAKQLVGELMGRRDAEAELARSEALAAGADAATAQAAAEAALTAFDARYGPLLVEGMAGGVPTLGNQDFVDTVTLGETGTPRSTWRFLLPVRDTAVVLVRPAADLDAAATAALVDDIRAVVDEQAPAGTRVRVTGTPVMVTALSDRATADAPRLAAIAVGAVAGCFLLARWIRPRRRLAPLALTGVAVATTVALHGWLDRPLSLGTVAFLSVLLGIGCYYPTYALTRARLRTVVVVGTATAASLATLALSPMPLVRDVGVTLGLGVLVCLGLAVAARRWLGDAAATAAPAAASRPIPGGPGGPGGPGAARVVVGVLAVVALAGWLALPSLEVRADVEHFAGGVPELADARHAEDVVGSSGEVDVVLRGVDVLAPEALAWMDAVTEVVAREHGDVMRAVVSPATLLGFVGDDATPEQVEAAARLLPSYLLAAVTTPDRSTAVLSYGVRLDDVAGLGAVRSDLLRALPPPPPGYEVELTGLPLVLAEGHDVVAADRLPANLAGIGVAGAVLLLGLRRRGDAVRAVAAAVLATGAGFALLALAGMGLDPVTVALGALTTAVGCEFTVVLAEAERRRSRALRRAVLLVAATSAAGYLALLGSGLGVVRGFGAQLAVAVLLALVSSWAVVAASVRSETGPPDDGSPEATEPGAVPRPAPTEAGRVPVTA